RRTRSKLRPLAVSPCFFFFQAEDGIRDGHVTGVQTCALPIFALWQVHRSWNRPRDLVFDHSRIIRMRLSSPGSSEPKSLVETNRSEERRVGKECRSWWSQYH